MAKVTINTPGQPDVVVEITLYSTITVETGMIAPNTFVLSPTPKKMLLIQSAESDQAIAARASNAPGGLYVFPV